MCYCNCKYENYWGECKLTHSGNLLSKDAKCYDISPYVERETQKEYDKRMQNISDDLNWNKQQRRKECKL